VVEQTLLRCVKCRMDLICLCLSCSPLWWRKVSFW
jgi:hypothetical protein